MVFTSAMLLENKNILILKKTLFETECQLVIDINKSAFENNIHVIKKRGVPQQNTGELLESKYSYRDQLFLIQTLWQHNFDITLAEMYSIAEVDNE